MCFVRLNGKGKGYRHDLLSLYQIFNQILKETKEQLLGRNYQQIHKRIMM